MAAMTRPPGHQRTPGPTFRSTHGFTHRFTHGLTRRLTRALDDLRQDLRFAWRTFRGSPGFSLTVVLTLALGIGANTAIFSVIDGVLLRPLPYPSPDRLVTLWERNPQKGFEQERVTGPNFIDWRAGSRAVEHLAHWMEPAAFNIEGRRGMEKATAAYVSSSLFHALGVAPQRGRTFLSEDDQHEGPSVAVIGHAFWQRHYGGDADVVGRPLTVDTYGRRTYTVVGVMPPGFDFPNGCEVWLPAAWMDVRLDERRGAHWYHTIGRLRDDATVESARSELSAIQARLALEHPNLTIGNEVDVVPLLDQTVGLRLRRALFIIWAIVGCVLLIACANVANLLLARAAIREREIGLRLALGATRGRVIRQLLCESLILAVTGGALGILLAMLGVRLLVLLHASAIPRLQDVRIDSTALLFTLAAACLTTLLVGLVPAWQASRRPPDDALKAAGARTTAGAGSHRLRNLLVVSEVALALMLLFGAGLMVQTFLRLLHTERGFRAERLLTARIEFSISGFTTWIRPTATRPQVTLQAVVERLRDRPGVQAVAAVSGLPRAGGFSRTQTLAIEHRPISTGDTITAHFQGVTPDYFRTMGIPLLHGRAFTERDIIEAPAVVIINEAMAKRYFPNQNPVGQRVAMFDRNRRLTASNPNVSSPWIEIVGVVRNMKTLELVAETLPDAYVPYGQWPMQAPTIVMRTAANPADVAAAIRADVKAVNPNLPPPEIETMDAILGATVAQPRFQMTLMAVFGLTALVLAAVGIYSVIACAVSQREREIGVRVALGAQHGDVLRLIVGYGMRLTLTGAAAGLFGAWALSRVMASLLYGGNARDPLAFAGVVGLLTLVSLLACWLPARRATRVDPMTALRAE